MTIYIVAAIAVFTTLVALSAIFFTPPATRRTLLVGGALAWIPGGILMGFGLTSYSPILFWIGLPIAASSLAYVAVYWPITNWQSVANHRRIAIGGLLGPLVIGVAALLLLHFGVLQQINFGDGDEAVAKTDFPDEVATQDMGELILDSVFLSQAGEVHEIAPGKFKGQVEDLVLEPGLVGVVLHYTDADENAATGKITVVDEDGNENEVALNKGNAIFPIELSLDQGRKWRFNQIAIKIGEDEKAIRLLVIEPSPTGLTGGDMVNTPTEVGGVVADDQPRTTVDLEVSNLFEDAFAQFCGFAPEEVVKVTLLPSDRDRFQVGWDGAGFVQSRNVIQKGQPIWTLVSKDNLKCRINPPCGNPEVVKGKLPVAPPGVEVSPPPPPGRPPSTPPATPPGNKKTPTPPPGSTPTNTPRNTPTNTPRNTPTNTPRDTPTPVPPRCLVTIIGPHRIGNTQTHARMQASIQWDQHPNFSPTIRWFLDGTFVGGGEQVQFMATLNVNHTLSVKVFKGQAQICSDSASFAEGSIPPGSKLPGSPPISTETPRPAPPPTTDPDDGYLGP